jgi:glycerophosphoryl diester phosphodiesterase
MLVLTGSNNRQQVDFHDIVPVGQKLLLFGAINDAVIPGATPEEKAVNYATLSAETVIPVSVTNYRRWVNFPWAVVEAGGQGKAGDWTAADNARLRALVARAHALHLWIRLYTLNGEDEKPAGGYNFGSAVAALDRWKAAIAAKVDFLATDQYEQFARVRSVQLGAQSR